MDQLKEYGHSFAPTLLKTMNAATRLRSEELHCCDVGGETPIHQLLHFKANGLTGSACDTPPEATTTTVSELKQQQIPPIQPTTVLEKTYAAQNRRGFLL